MATQPDKLIGDAVQQQQPLRAFPDHDGVRPGTFAAVAADVEIPHLTPVAYDAGTDTWKVWDDAIAAIDQIEGFVYSPAGDITLLAAGETIHQIFRKGSIHRDDIPLPTTASQTQNALDAALGDQAVRTLNIEVLGLANVH